MMMMMMMMMMTMMTMIMMHMIIDEIMLMFHQVLIGVLFSNLAWNLYLLE